MIKQRDTYNFCTKCRAELKGDDNFKICTNCHKHYYFNARPTVTIVLTNSKNEILLTKRAREPFKDWWDIPGGFVDEDESLEQAIARELEEELNFRPISLTYLTSFADNYPYRNELVSIVVAAFKGKLPLSAQIIVSDEIAEYKFVAKKSIEFDKIAFEKQREFLRNYLN